MSTVQPDAWHSWHSWSSAFFAIWQNITISM